MANRGKWKRRRRSCISITVNADHLVTEKVLRVLPLLPQAQRQIRPCQQKYQLFTLYQIRNKRMTWRTLLTLLSVRNGKRLADGIQGR